MTLRWCWSHLLTHFLFAPQLHGPTLHFRGARGMESVERLAAATGLDRADNGVFMCVCSLHLGRRLQTKQHGHFEMCITRVIPGVQVVKRIMEQNLHIRLRMVCKRPSDWPDSIRRELGPTLGFHEGATPTSLHIRIAFHGHVQLRFGYLNTPWTKATEEATLNLCQYFAAQFLKCC